MSSNNYPRASFTAKTTAPTDLCCIAQHSTTEQSPTPFSTNKSSVHRRILHCHIITTSIRTSPPSYQTTSGRSHSGVAFPKHTFSQNAKKAFRKGRPIVAFPDTMGPKLWEALADVLQLMTQQACPDAFHQGDGITQLTQTAAFLQESDKQHDPNNYILFNQDLAGFFTSVDKDRFFAAYSILARWYRDENHQHADTFYIDHCQKAPSHRVHRGKSRQKQQEASSGSKLGIHLKDIPRLISAVLLLNYFVVGQTLIEQFRGAPMGSPCSSALCNLVVAVGVGITRTLVFSSITSFTNIHHTSTPFILPHDTWTTEFYSFPNNFFRFRLLSNSPPHLFTSRRFSLKLNRPTFSWVSRWTPATARSHTSPNSPRQISSTPDLPQQHRHYEAVFRLEPD